MSINKFRGALYGLARFLGDVQAVRKGPTAVVKRLARKTVGRGYGKIMRKLLPLLLISSICWGQDIYRAARTPGSREVFRDRNGRLTGTVTTDKRGVSTFRDRDGRLTAKASQDSRGITTFRDRNGRIIAKGAKR